MRPEVGLADLIRAVARLTERGDDPVAIARVLRFGAGPPAAAIPRPSRLPAAQVRGARAATLGSATVSATATVTTGAQQHPVTAGTRLGDGPLTLRPLGKMHAAPPAWLAEHGQRLDLRTQREGAPPPLEPLFEPRRHRALLSAALATLDADGRLDLERLIERVATRRLDRRLPRLPRPSLHRGAWVLVDRTPAMEPFLDDVIDLADRIARVIGREATRIQQFMESPLRVWDAALFDDRPIELPPSGTPLVALTDLGARSGGGEWLDLLPRVRARGCRVIAIVPYPIERCPPALRAQVVVVPWDRATKVYAVKPRARPR